jgi:hypothetical protein
VGIGLAWFRPLFSSCGLMFAVVLRFRLLGRRLGSFGRFQLKGCIVFDSFGSRFVEKGLRAVLECFVV